MVTKKRELLPDFNSLIVRLSNLTGLVAKLEYHDNDTASRELKRKLADFELRDLKSFKDKVLGVRAEINNKSKTKKQLKNE